MKSNPWPIAIILTLVLFLAGTIGLVVMACSQRTDLVSANYYEQELRFQDRIDSLNRARELAHPLTATFDSETRQLIVSVSLDQAHEGLRGKITLYRPAAARDDVELNLAPNLAGIQRIETTGLATGLWKIRVAWTAGGQNYLVDQSFTNSADAPRKLPRS